MNTNQLLLDRALDLAADEDYVAWAVSRLVAGDDTPALRVLAGLNPSFDRQEIGKYFLRACQQLSIELPDLSSNRPRDAATLIGRLFDLEVLSAEHVVGRMARLYVESDYSDPLLEVWYYIDQELSVRGTPEEAYLSYYPHGLRNLDAVVRREWQLFEWGVVGSHVPAGFTSFTRCEDCGHISMPVLRRKTLLEAIKARLPWVRPEPPLCAACSRCGSFNHRSISDPEVRKAYLARSEGS